MQRDDAYLLDILIAARQISMHTKDVSEADFGKNELLQLAVVKLLENIGEAARAISIELKEAHSEIEWSGMIRMRNRLVHEYFRISVVRVWTTVQEDLPKLIAAVEPLIPPEGK